MRRVRKGLNGGFSLIELMVVVIILGLIGGIAVMSWQSLLPNQRLNTAVRTLSEDLYGTRSEAIARNHEFRIYYDLDKETYEVRTPYKLGGGFANPEDAEEEEDERIRISRRNLGEKGVELQNITIDDETYYDGVVYVRFDPLGASSNHRIVLRQAEFNRTFTLEVLPITGEIRFHDGVYEREPADERDFQ